MLIKQRFLEGIVDGSITLAYRRQKRPTVRAGGTLRTSIGVVAIDTVEVVTDQQISSDDALRAGFGNRSDLLDSLRRDPDAQLYRIQLRFAGPDPRIRLRESAELSNDDLAELKRRLQRFDSSQHRPAWTVSVLRQIAETPGTRAPDLAAAANVETKRYKLDVRKLKELGLTESLKVGYRLSPRGVAALRLLDQD